MKIFLGLLCIPFISCNNYTQSPRTLSDKNIPTIINDWTPTSNRVLIGKLNLKNYELNVERRGILVSGGKTSGSLFVHGMQYEYEIDGRGGLVLCLASNPYCSTYEIAIN